MSLGLVVAIIAILVVFLICHFLFGAQGLGFLSYAHGSRRSPKIAITFDDGPSPLTPEILSLLKSYGVPATFFITGKKARKFPEYVEAIKKDGHELESHGHWHSFWVFFSPFHEWYQLKSVPSHYYRPPYGIVGPFTHLLCRLLGKQLVLWDLESKDWSNVPSQNLVERLLYYTRPGSIILFHDNNEKTLEILKSFLPRLLELGYEPVVLKELQLQRVGLRLGLIRALQWFDEQYDRRHRIHRVGFEPFEILRYVQVRIRHSLPLEIPKGSIAFELHLDSRRVMELSPMETLRALKGGVEKLAVLLEKNPEIQWVYARGYLAQWFKVLGFKIYTGPFPRLQWLLDALAGIWALWLYRGKLPKKGRPLVTLAYIARSELLKGHHQVGEPWEKVFP